MSKRPSASTSSRLRRTRLPASPAASGTLDRSRTSARTPRPTGKSSSPIRRSAVAQSASSSSCAESTAWSRDDRGHGVAQPDERRLDGDLLDQHRQPAGGRQETAYLVGLGGEVDRLPAGRADAAQEEVDGGTLEGELGLGHRQRPDPDDRLARLAGSGPRGDDHAGVRGALQHRLQHRTGPGPVEVEAVEHQQAGAPVDGPAQRTGQGVAGCELGVEARQRRDEHLVEAAQVAGVDPRRAPRRSRGGARRSVLPLPGGPTTVTQRDSSRASASARWTSPRPRQGDSTDESIALGAAGPGKRYVGLRMWAPGGTRESSAYAAGERDRTGEGPACPRPRLRAGRAIVGGRCATCLLCVARDACRGCVRWWHGTRARPGRPRWARRRRAGCRQVQQEARSWPGPRRRSQPVKRLAEEDVTALGVELQDLDIDMAGEPLDPGANADYQRALDAYESAKTAAAASSPAPRTCAT